MRPRLDPRSSRRARAFGRLVIASLIAAAVLVAGVPEEPASAARAAGPLVFPWPRCTPLCTRAPTRGPRVTAIYVSTPETQPRVMVRIDAFAAGVPGPTVTGELCYQPHHATTEPGCIVTATTHGRRVGGGVWWVRFRTPVYERYQISNSSSHALVRSYWFGVSVAVGHTSAQGSRQGVFDFAGP